jgi:hypothetical protein
LLPSERSETALRVRFSRDGSNGEAVRQWLVNVAVSPQHGWALHRLAGARTPVLGSPADCDSILDEIEALGLIERVRKDLTYAPEIRFFGVGGVPGDRLDRDHVRNPVLFLWQGTTRLGSCIRWLRDRQFSGDFAAGLYTYARALAPRAQGLHA